MLRKIVVSPGHKLINMWTNKISRVHQITVEYNTFTESNISIFLDDLVIHNLEPYNSFKYIQILVQFWMVNQKYAGSSFMIAQGSEMVWFSREEIRNKNPAPSLPFCTDTKPDGLVEAHTPNNKKFTKERYFRPQFCTVRLHWAGDNLG